MNIGIVSLRTWTISRSTASLPSNEIQLELRGKVLEELSRLRYLRVILNLNQVRWQICVLIYIYKGSEVKPIDMESSNQPANHEPLLLDSRTGELYLQLPSPNDNVRITPPRPGDVEATVKLLNDERVFTWLAGPPCPYTQEDGIMWNSSITDKYQELFQRIKAGERILDGCPVQCIREMHADGTDTFIGDISIRRESTQVAWVPSENKNKAVGDPTIVWTIGFYLAVSHHRRGITSAAVGMLIDNWAIPRMNCQRIIASAMLGNAASVGVFKKNGFRHLRDVEDAIRLPEGRGGHLKSLHLMEWTYNDN